MSLLKRSAIGVSVLVVSFLADASLACTKAVLIEHVVEPDPADTVSPSPPAGVQAHVSRRLGTKCDDKGCITNTCGDSASVRITFVPATDDRSAPEDIRYRLVSSTETLPSSLASIPGFAGSTGQRDIELGFDEAGQLDVEASLVAVDAGGNASAPSDPFRIAFSGCTFPLDSDTCIETNATGCSIAAPSKRHDVERQPWVWGLLLLCVSAAWRGLAPKARRPIQRWVGR